MDAYVYSPSGKKLQSKSELFEFVRENTKYLKNLDPTEVNFSKHHGETRPAAAGPLITKFIQEIETLKMDSGLIEDNNNPLLDGKSECCKLKFFFLIYKYKMTCGIVMDSGTRKPETQGKTPTFLLPEFDFCYPNPSIVMYSGRQNPTFLVPKPENGTRTRPEPDFCYPNPSLMWNLLSHLVIINSCTSRHFLLV